MSVVLGAAAIAAAALPSASHAQPSRPGGPPAPAAVDQRWLPWLGCWQLVEETGPLPESAGGLSAFANRVLVCVAPSSAPAAANVVVTTLADGEQVLAETLSADGVEHPVEQGECRGRRTLTWSDDGARLYTRAALACGGGDARRLSGIGLILDNGNWLSLEMVEAGERAAVTVRRYRRAGDVTTLGAAGPTLTADLLARARIAARRAGGADLTIESVIEAGTEVEPAVLEALLVETEATFDLDGRTLIRLDDGGVPGEIIDMLVALSFPEDFQVRRSAPTGGGGGGFLSSWGGYGYDAWYPYYAAPFGYYHGWSPYRSLYGWGDYYYLSPGYYGLPGSGFVDAPEASEGRFYEGYGYTRVATPRDGGRRAQPRGTAAAASPRDGGRRAQPRGTAAAASPRDGGRPAQPRGTSAASGGGWSSGGRSSGGSSRGGGRVSSGGYTRGGSSSSGGGRTATPRDP